MKTQIASSTARGALAPRRYELDWLRTLVVLGIVPYHALVIFGASSAVYIKSAQSNPALALVGGFVLTWGIPTIFLMSGAATRLALERRSPGAYVRERLSRLVVPMVLVALVFSPLQAYFILLSNPGLVSMSPVPIHDPEQLSNFGTFYGTYITLLFTTVRAYSPSIGTLALAHVWFIPRLLVVSLLTLLLIVCLRWYRRHGRYGQRVARVIHLKRLPAMALLGGGVVTALIVALLQPGWLNHLTEHWIFTDVWADFALDFALFICGYLIYGRRRLYTAVSDLRVVTLVLGLLCWAAVAGVTFAGKAPPASFAPVSLAYSTAVALSAWLLSLALLGFAMRYFTFTTRQQRYLTYAAFPVYILHMPILTVCAYYVLKLSLPWYVQLPLILAVTVVLAFGIFEFVIRRTPVTRFLFGVGARVPHDDTPTGFPPVPPGSSSPSLLESRGARTASAESSAPVEESDDASESNLAQLFRNRSRQYAGSIRWRKWGGESSGADTSVTYAGQQALVNRLISGLDALGARQGDMIGILSGTRWEWIVADWAIMGLGAATVTLYPTLPQETLAFILRDSGARFLFIEDETQFAKLRDVLDELPQLQRLFVFDECRDPLARERTVSFATLLSLSTRTAAEADEFAAECAQRIQPDTRAALIYTSGTTGQPKGVIHTHRTLLAQLAGTRAMLPTVHAGMRDTLFLPLSHVLGRLEHLFTLDRGAETTIHPSIEHLAQDIRITRPDILLGVPRIFEKAYAAVMEHQATASAVERMMFSWATRVGHDAIRYRPQRRSALPLALRLQLPVADALVFRRIRAAFGGQLQFAVSGGAPLDPSIAEFFYAVGIPLLEGWGLTETGGTFTLNRLDDFRIGTVGTPLPCHQVRIAADGEVLVRGPCVFPGYHNNVEATAEAFDADGWFHTGDVGVLDRDGFLTIIDRKKELIVTSGGKKIAPQLVEGLLKTDPLVSQACVYGDSKPYVVALLTIDWTAAGRWADREGVPYSTTHGLATSPALRAYLDRHVQRVNAHLARFEQVKYFDILDGDFTVDNGPLTPSQKIRRKAVNACYRERFEALYTSAHGEPVRATASHTETASAQAK